jgi:acetyl esterase
VTTEPLETQPTMPAWFDRSPFGAPSSLRTPLIKLRQRAGSLVVDNFFRAVSRLGSMHPKARPEVHGVRVERDVPYLSTGLPEHRLDIYRPEGKTGPLPTVLYVHGGGFRILSKDTHWVMGLAFARAGYLTFNISYRLAPRHRFPAALEDCTAAYEWLLRHGPDHGADLDRLIFAGESAGANLVTSLALLTCYQRREPWAARVFDHGVVPRAVLPYCGVLQVSDADRFRRRRPNLPAFIQDRLIEVTHAYLGNDHQSYGELLDLADPLTLLERGLTPHRPLPAWFVTVGTADPLLDDSRRMGRALETLGAAHEVRYYPGEVHAFHAMVWRPQAKACWQHTFRFLEHHVPAGGP